MVDAAHAEELTEAAKGIEQDLRGRLRLLAGVGVTVAREGRVIRIESPAISTTYEILPSQEAYEDPEMWEELKTWLMRRVGEGSGIDAEIGDKRTRHMAEYAALTVATDLVAMGDEKDNDED